MINPVSISIYGKRNEVDSFLKNINDVNYQIEPPKMAFDSGINSSILLNLSLTFASDVAVSLVAKWIYDKLKNGNKNKKKNESIVKINGNLISGENITVIQIVDIISSNSVQ